MPIRHRLIVPALVAIIALPAAAALPPKHQRLAELRAVLDHPAIAEAFDDQGPVERVERLGPDLYRVSAGACHVDVRIVDLPTPRDVAGPRRFEARPGERECDIDGR